MNCVAGFGVLLLLAATIMGIIGLSTDYWFSGTAIIDVINEVDNSTYSVSLKMHGGFIKFCTESRSNLTGETTKSCNDKQYFQSPECLDLLALECRSCKDVYLDVRGFAIAAIMIGGVGIFIAIAKTFGKEYFLHIVSQISLLVISTLSFMFYIASWCLGSAFVKNSKCVSDLPEVRAKLNPDYSNSLMIASWVLCLVAMFVFALSGGIIPAFFPDSVLGMERPQKKEFGGLKYYSQDVEERQFPTQEFTPFPTPINH